MELLKIDVEGFELEVLQGARSMISAHRVTTIILEYSHFWDGKLRSLAERMEFEGYDGYWLGSRGVVPFSGPEMAWWHELYEVCAQFLSYRPLVIWI